MRKPYPSDRTDAPWEIIKPLIPVNVVWRPRVVELREVLNALSYLDRSDGPWDLLPHDQPPRSTVHDDYYPWRSDGTWQALLDALRQKVRVAAGKEPSPSAGSIESQTVTATEVADERGVRRGQEGHPAEATPHRGYLGVAPGRGGHRGLRLRRHDCPPRCWVTDGRAPQSAGVALGGPEGPQPPAQRLAGRDPGRLSDRGGESRSRSRGVCYVAPAVGGGADLRRAGAVSSEQPGLRAIRRVERGDDQGKLDSSNAQTLET
jgi:transposase